MSTDKGIIKIILIIVVAILVLSYFGYNIRSIATSPTSQDNFSYIGEVLSNVWNNYLKTPAMFVWNIFVEFVWNPAMNALRHDNTATSQMQTAGNMLPIPQAIK